jgi:hypothetical protein
MAGSTSGRNLTRTAAHPCLFECQGFVLQLLAHTAQGRYQGRSMCPRPPPDQLRAKACQLTGGLQVLRCGPAGNGVEISIPGVGGALIGKKCLRHTPATVSRTKKTNRRSIEHSLGVTDP